MGWRNKKITRSNMRLVNEGKYKYATREKNPTNDDNMIYYSEDYPYDYTITADWESVISLPDIPVGAQIVRVDLELKPLRSGVPASAGPAEYSWEPTARILTLIPGPALETANADPRYPTSEGQLLSVIYKIKKTTL